MCLTRRTISRPNSTSYSPLVHNHFVLFAIQKRSLHHRTTKFPLSTGAISQASISKAALGTLVKHFQFRRSIVFGGRGSFRPPVRKQGGSSLYDSPNLVHSPSQQIIYPSIKERLALSELVQSAGFPPPKDGIIWRPMRSYLQFLTTPTADTPGTTLLLHFENKRYLFGSLAEGTQRAAIEQGARWLKVSEVFITGRTEWQNNGGLIGLILTLADVASTSAASSAEDLKRKITTRIKKENGGIVDEEAVIKELERSGVPKTKVTLFGAPNLNYTLATARRFVFRKGMPIDAREVSGDTAAKHKGPVFQDNNIKVWAMAVLPEQISSSPRGFTNGGTVSPRKRSYDELTGAEAQSGDIARSDLTDSEKTALMAKSVVSDMFDSSWRVDALVETPINDVKMPATLFVRNTRTNKIEKYEGPMPGGPRPVPNVQVLVRRPWPGALVDTLPPTQPAKESVSYIIRNHPQRGKFIPSRALELGLTDKSKWKILTGGTSIQNDKGETITPDMVLEAGKEGAGAAIIDIPSNDYVEPLLRRSEWKSEEIMAGVGVFVWILGPGVMESPALKLFIEQRSHVKHVFTSPEACPNRLSLDSAAKATIRLAKIDPARYVTPVHSNDRANAVPIPEALQVADRGHTIQLEPTLEIKTEPSSAPVMEDAIVSGLSSEVLRLASEAQENVQDDRVALDAWAAKLPQDDAEIVTLGTGSALPSKYRNVSATLLRVPGWGCLLFDCGENTLGQLKRVFPPDEFEQILRELRMIWISHMHADHHLGTVSVIKAWYQGVHKSKPINNPDLSATDQRANSLLRNKDRLAVVSDLQMLHWLSEYSQIEDYGFSRIAPLYITPAKPKTSEPSTLHWFMPSGVETTDALSAFESPGKRHERLTVFARHLDLVDIQAVKVAHCYGALAVSVTFASGFKASYSGDCRPTQNFATIGKDSTVCIHEATFDDELKGDALAKSHSTTSEALGIAQAMNAKACVLTHFSQRYQKVPVLEYTEQEQANDLMDTGIEGEEDIATTEGELCAPLSEAVNSTTAAGPPPTVSEDDRPSAPISGAVKQTTIKLNKGSDMKVCIAFDYMRVKVADIAQMEKFTPALLGLFADEETGDGKEDGEAKANGNGKQKQNKDKQKQQKGKGKRNN